MAQTPDKYEYPTGQDPFQPHRDIKKLAESITGIVPVANRTEADTIVAELQPTYAEPLYVNRQDTGALERNRGNGWELIFRQPTGWQPVSFLSVHGNADHGYSCAAMIDSSGWARLRGRSARVSGSTTDYSPGTTYDVFELPVGMAPAATFSVTGTVSGFADVGVSRIEIKSSGVVSVGVSKNTGWVGYDSTSWYVG
ncbi:MAG TPA: hypothetical protein VK054_07010 [Beutenbergiaceae bacterium]|nr:hypothetical protein [Beutenbergiaceae bacterium]